MMPKRYRTLFLSDVHLGSKSAKADFLIDFLRHNEADRIYLVGDIVDGWRLKRSWHWPQRTTISSRSCSARRAKVSRSPTSAGKPR